jgi:hypothetical protein
VKCIGRTLNKVGRGSVRLTPAQWIELSTDDQTDFGAIGTVSTNPGVQGRQEDTLQVVAARLEESVQDGNGA